MSLLASRRMLSTARFFHLSLLGLACSLVLASAPPAVAGEQAFGMPLRFEPVTGAGASGEPQAFLARGLGHGLRIGGAEAVLVIGPGPHVPPDVVTLRLLGADAAAPLAGERRLPGRTHDFVGADPARWRTGIPTYAAVRSRDVYPGIDVVWYGRDGWLEHDFVVAPGADPGRIVLAFEGTKAPRLDAGGELVLDAASSRLVLQAPVAHQAVAGGRRTVEARFDLRPDGTVGFVLGDHDPDVPLVIDPVVRFSTFFGGSSAEEAYDLDVDPAGNVTIVGFTASPDLPGAGGTVLGFWDMFAARFDAAGELVYSTYFNAGGDFDTKEYATGVDADDEGNAYITGRTNSTTFPTLNALQPVNAGGNDALVVKLDPQGQIVFSTYLGGSDHENDMPESVSRIGEIIVDPDGFILVAGSTRSADFPVVNALQPLHAGGLCQCCGSTQCNDVFLARLTPDGQALVHSTFLGGNFSDQPKGMLLAPDGSIYLGGDAAPGFPTTAGTFSNGQVRAFVTRLDADASEMLFSMVYGPGDFFDFDLGPDGRIYVAGDTSSFGYPTTPGAWQEEHGGCFKNHCWQGFVSVFSPDASTLLHSTYIGGPADNEAVTALAVDAAGNALFTVSNEDNNSKLWVLDPTLSDRLELINLIGSGQCKEIELDERGAAYVTGFIWNNALLTVTPDAFQTSGGGNRDAFVTVIDFQEGPWTDLGGGSGGAFGVPELAGTGSLQPGAPTTLQLSDAPPSAPALLWVATASTPLAAFGGTLHAFPVAAEFLLGTDAGGALGAAGAWPAGVPDGTVLWFQVLALDVSVPGDVVLSNGLQAAVP